MMVASNVKTLDSLEIGKMIPNHDSNEISPAVEEDHVSADYKQRDDSSDKQCDDGSSAKQIQGGCTDTPCDEPGEKQYDEYRDQQFHECGEMHCDESGEMQDCNESGEKQYEKSGEKQLDGSSDTQREEAGDKQGEELGEKQIDESVENQCNKSGENQYDESGEKECDESGKNRCDDFVENQCDKSGENQFDESGEMECDESGENQYDEFGEKECDESGENQCDESTEKQCDESAENRRDESEENQCDQSGRNQYDESGEKECDEAGGNHCDESTEKQCDESAENRCDESAEKQCDESGEKQYEDDSNDGSQSLHSACNQRGLKLVEGSDQGTASHADVTSIEDESDDHTFSSYEQGSEIESLGSEVVDSDCESHNQRKRITGYHGGKLAGIYDKLNDTESACLNFAMEHRIFLKAILGFIAERDQKATDVGIYDPNMIKSGPLKKSSHLVSGVWKVKFVEVRRGMFSYYEDAVSEKDSMAGSLLRKNVPLDFNSCSCRAVKVHRKGLNITPGGSIFELKAGGVSRLWSAKSRDERHAWIQAINDAMVGGSVTRGNDTTNEHGRLGVVNSKSPYKDDLKKYLKVKNTLKNAKSKEEYIRTLREALLGHNLDVPVKWIMEQLNGSMTNGAGAFHEETVSNGIEQLRKDLLRDSIKINDELFHGDSGHAPEKIIAALARTIVAISCSSKAATSHNSTVPESKAFAYARDVLLSTNRTRSGGDSYYCIDGLCNNPFLVVTVPSSREAEPLSVSVELDETDGPASGYSINDKSGWIRTRNRMQRSWRKRFFVLSEGTLSFYRNELPRPHGLRGQLVVSDATISVDRSKEKSSSIIVSIVTTDGLKDRFLLFNNEDKFLAWTYALECTAKGPSSMMSVGKGVFRMRSAAKEANKSQDSTKAQDGSVSVEQSMKEHVARLGLAAGNDLQGRMAHLSAKTGSSLKISVQASTEYKICTTDPQGDDEDTWATISSTFLQTFCINGGRIVRGEEMVRVNVSHCLDVADPTQENPTHEKETLSPTGVRIKLGRRVLARNRTETTNENKLLLR